MEHELPFMNKSRVVSSQFFFVFLFIIFLFEGLGIQGGREVACYLILIMPFFLFLSDFLAKKDLMIPQKLTTFYSLFLLFSIASTIFSLNIYRSFPLLLMYFSLFLIFLFVSNHEEQIKKYILPILFVFSSIYAIYSLFLPIILQNNIQVLIPEYGYQFVFAKFGLHNHLGDFLLIPLVFCIYEIFKRRQIIRNAILLIITMPFFLFSYSRSAYVSVILTCFIMLWYFLKKEKKQIGKRVLSIFGILLIVILFFFSMTVTELQNVLPVTFLNRLPLNVFVANKVLLSPRINFTEDAFCSISDRPFFGVGPNNYLFISGSCSYLQKEFTYTAHNLFFDVFVEEGIFAGISFLLFIFFALKQAKKDTVLFFILLALLLNFQTDYTYRMYSFFLLFFLLLALVQHHSTAENQKIPSLIPLSIAGIMFLIGQYLLLTGMLLPQ